MDMLRSPVNDCCDAPDIRFPLSIAAPVGVADLDAERHTLAAILTFSQLLHLLKCRGSVLAGIYCVVRTAFLIITEDRA